MSYPRTYEDPYTLPLVCFSLDQVLSCFSPKILASPLVQGADFSSGRKLASVAGPVVLFRSPVWWSLASGHCMKVSLPRKTQLMIYCKKSSFSCVVYRYYGRFDSTQLLSRDWLWRWECNLLLFVAAPFFPLQLTVKLPLQERICFCLGLLKEPLPDVVKVLCQDSCCLCISIVLQMNRQQGFYYGQSNHVKFIYSDVKSFHVFHLQPKEL